MTNVKQVIIILAVFIMLGICVSSAAAGTYSITQTSKYTYSTDNTPLDPLGMHRDISDWADPDITDCLANIKKPHECREMEIKSSLYQQRINNGSI